MPEQPTNEKKKVDGEPKKISAPEADKAVEKVTNLSKSSETSTSTKRRFSDSTQDSQSSSSTQITTNDRPNPTTTTKNPSPARTTSSNPRTANQWEKTAFVGDSDGAKRVKFLRLSNCQYIAT
ncbi:hypothetical protein BGZ46_008729 [Entomortierella lignicola]|nr:hypothetical protein BGZ46_008729 [Entomortierella lignicola]